MSTFPKTMLAIVLLALAVHPSRGDFVVTVTEAGTSNSFSIDESTPYSFPTALSYSQTGSVSFFVSPYGVGSSINFWATVGNYTTIGTMAFTNSPGASFPNPMGEIDLNNTSVTLNSATPNGSTNNPLVVTVSATAATSTNTYGEFTTPGAGQGTFNNSLIGNVSLGNATITNAGYLGSGTGPNGYAPLTFNQVLPSATLNGGTVVSAPVALSSPYYLQSITTVTFTATTPSNPNMPPSMSNGGYAISGTVGSLDAETYVTPYISPFTASTPGPTGLALALTGLPFLALGLWFKRRGIKFEA